VREALDLIAERKTDDTSDVESTRTALQYRFKEDSDKADDDSGTVTSTVDVSRKPRLKLSNRRPLRQRNQPTTTTPTITKPNKPKLRQKQPTRPRSPTTTVRTTNSFFNDSTDNDDTPENNSSSPHRPENNAKMLEQEAEDARETWSVRSSDSSSELDIDKMSIAEYYDMLSEGARL